MVKIEQKDNSGTSPKAEMTKNLVALMMKVVIMESDGKRGSPEVGEIRKQMKLLSGRIHGKDTSNNPSLTQAIVEGNKLESAKQALRKGDARPWQVRDIKNRAAQSVHTLLDSIKPQ